MLEEEQQCHALTVLTRLCQHSPSHLDTLVSHIRTNVDALAPLALDVALETGAPMPEALSRAIVGHRPSPRVLLAMLDRIPEDTHLRELALLLAGELADSPRSDVLSIVDALVRHAFWLRLNREPHPALRALRRARLIAEEREARVPASTMLRHHDVEVRTRLDLDDVSGAAAAAQQGLDLAHHWLPDQTEPWKALFTLQLARTKARLGERVAARALAYEAETMWRELMHRPDPGPGAFDGLPRMINIAGPGMMETFYNRMDLGSGTQIGAHYLLSMTMASDGTAVLQSRRTPPSQARDNLFDAVDLLVRLNLADGLARNAARGFERINELDLPVPLTRTQASKSTFLTAIAQEWLGNHASADALIAALPEPWDGVELIELVQHTMQLAYPGPKAPGQFPSLVAIAGLAARHPDDGTFASVINSLLSYHVSVNPADEDELKDGIEQVLRSRSTPTEKARLLGAHIALITDETYQAPIKRALWPEVRQALSWPLNAIDTCSILHTVHVLVVHSLHHRIALRYWQPDISERAMAHDHDAEVREAYVGLCPPLVALAVYYENFGTVESVLADLAVLAGRYPDDEILVAHARCVLTVVGEVGSRGYLELPAAAIRQAEGALRSLAFRACYEAETGKSSEELLEMLDEILALVLETEPEDESDPEDDAPGTTPGGGRPR